MTSLTTSRVRDPLQAEYEELATAPGWWVVRWPGSRAVTYLRDHDEAVALRASLEHAPYTRGLAWVEELP